MKGEKPYNRRAAWSWAAYDVGNSAFATTVIAGFFPVFYGSFWREGAEPGQATSELARITAVAGICVAIIAPIVGAIADRVGGRKLFLALFTILGALCTAALATIDQTMGLLALVTFAVANLGFNAGLVTYDAMLVDVAPDSRMDSISALGYALGYIGGGFLLFVNILMFQRPELFGLTDATAGVRASFVTVAVWWALFTIPLMLFVKERPVAQRVGVLEAARSGITEVIGTVRQLYRLQNLLLFLLAYVLYIDGVNTVIRTAVSFGQEMGFDRGALITALLLTQFVAFPAALFFGFLGRKLGARTGIMIGLSVYMLVSLTAPFMRSEMHFYLLAVMVGLVQGGVQSLSRSFFARLVPVGREAEFFGFYNMVGRAAAFMGPVLIWLGFLLYPDWRFSLMNIVVLFLIGALLLSRVREERAVIAPAADLPETAPP